MKDMLVEYKPCEIYRFRSDVAKQLLAAILTVDTLKSRLKHFSSRVPTVWLSSLLILLYKFSFLLSIFHVIFYYAYTLIYMYMSVYM